MLTHLQVELFSAYFIGNSFSSNFKSLHRVMSKYPNLVKYSSSVDHFSPWSYDAYVKIATAWLQDVKPKVTNAVVVH